MAENPHPLRSVEFALAVALAGLAGWVDATAFVRFARTYVSFMSGNSTALASSLSAAHAPKIALLIAALGSFVAGVIAGESIAMAARRHRRPAALVAEAIVLLVAGVAAFSGRAILLPIVLLATALGIQNAALHEAGGMRVALTYVTGTLVRFGRAIAAALAGRGAWAGALPHLFLWVGLMAGAGGGAALARASAPAAIFVAAGGALGLAAAARFCPGL